MNLIQLLPSKKPRPRETWRVLVTSPTQATLAGEDKPRTLAVNEEIVVDVNEARALMGAGRIVPLQRFVDGQAVTSAEEYALPGRREPRPPPWDDSVPSVFSDYFRELERRQVLLEYISSLQSVLARSVTVAIRGLVVYVGTDVVGREQKAREVIEGKIRSAREDLRKLDLVKLARSAFRAGAALLKLGDQVEGLRLEKQRLAFEAFRARLAPLGLHEDHERRLFVGSALYSQYECANDTFRLQGRRQGRNESGELEDCIEASPAAAVSMWRRLNARADHLRKLIEQAEAELQQVNTIMTKEGKKAS